MRWRSLVIPVALLAAVSSARAADEVTFFEKKIRPVLAEHCYKCHSAESKKLKGGLRLDTAAGIRKGGDSGPLFVAGQPKQSLLITVLRHEDTAMPPNGKLADGIINDFVGWIERGAALPAEVASGPGPRREAFRITDADRQHWAFQPLARPRPPAVEAATDIDRFLRAALQAQQLAPAEPADKYTLLRRATHDLTGLPPTLAEIQDFLADDSPQAFARVVDRLLASKEFGVRWGRHWLDGVRYASDVDKSGQYRDWVVRSFNADLPYDRFVMLQLAGDLLPADASDPSQRHVSGAALDGMAASGMLALAVWEKVARDLAVAEIVDSQIDVVGRQFLGLTLACARCHDHKFDPVSAEDYYALAGIFFSTRISAGKLIADGRLSDEVITVPLLSQADDRKNRALDEQIGQLKKELAAAAEPLAGGARLLELAAEIPALAAKERAVAAPAKAKLAEQLAALRKEEKELTAAADPAGMARFDELRGRIAALAAAKVKPPLAMTAQEGGVPGSNREKIADAPVLIRGDFRREGKIVPRGVPVILAGDSPVRISQGSGRLELAQWIARADNPLTARVMANRVWQHLFGEGLVRTPSNFGRLGEPPTHPELLDHLASRFVEQGWSVKRLIRDLMLTQAYQQASFASPELLRADPANRLVGRMNRKRLSYESIRDSLLFVSGHLRLSDAPAAAGRPLRTMFDPVERARSNGMMTMFDGPDPKAIMPERADTTTAPQALFMMNNPLVMQSAQRIDQLLRGDGSLRSDTERVDHVFRRLLGRPAADHERGIALAYVQKSSWTNLLQVLLCTNEFVYVD